MPSMPWMGNAYDQLLEATIQHLSQLKERGTRFVAVSPETLAGLGARNPRPPSPARPAPRPEAPRPPLVPPPPPAMSPVSEPVVLERAPSLPSPVTLAPATAATVSEAAEPISPSPAAKAAAWADLQRRVMACAKCAHLATARTNVVFGVGNREADLMFVGEAPGADEDEQGEPFVGKAGQLLTKIIQTMGLTRESVYIGNILKCRPDTPGQTAGNRKPTPAEMQTCLPYLHEQIDLIRPKVLVALGATAVEGLLGKTAGITRLRGHWQLYRGIPLMPTYHPAYLLRNQALSEKRRVWEDMLQVMEKLGWPISEKQRRYFLAK